MQYVYVYVLYIREPVARILSRGHLPLLTPHASRLARPLHSTRKQGTAHTDSGYGYDSSKQASGRERRNENMNKQGRGRRPCGLRWAVAVWLLFALCSCSCVALFFLFILCLNNVEGGMRGGRGLRGGGAVALCRPPVPVRWTTGTPLALDDRRGGRLLRAQLVCVRRKMAMDRSRKGPMPEERAWCLLGHTGGGHTGT